VKFLLPIRRMKVEVYDESGNRYVISFEGRVTRDKALKILDIVELLGGMPVGEPIQYPQDVSKIEKVLLVVKKNFPIAWFSAREVQEAYERETGEPISLSAVSTYLSRLANKGILIRIKKANRVSFRLASEEVKELVRSF